MPTGDNKYISDAARKVLLVLPNICHRAVLDGQYVVSSSLRDVQKYALLDPSAE